MVFVVDPRNAQTIRKNPTTQIEIRVAEWPGNTFLLWLPEAVSDLWNNWTADVAHQDFRRTDREGLLWTFDRHPAGLVEAELIPGEGSLLLEVCVTNLLNSVMNHVSAQNCFHLSAAPDFACDDFSRIHIRTGGQWRSLSSLTPTCDLPMYYRPGFLRSGRRDNWGGRYTDRNQAAEADHPLMVCVSKDGSRSIGTVSEDYQCLFHNRGIPYLRCIHSQQAPVPALGPGQKIVFRQKVYFVEGGLMDCVSAFEADVGADGFRDPSGTR